MKHFIFFLLATLFIINTKAQEGEFITFNGTDQYMTIPNHDDFNIQQNENFTVSCWINIPEFKANGNSRFISKRDISSNLADKSGYELWGANDANHYYATNTPNSANNHNNSLSKWPPNYTGQTDRWTHIAFVVDRTQNRMYEYIDGVNVVDSENKDISVWAANNPYDVHVGCGISGNSPTLFFKGKIDNLRFYKKALSAAELADDMNTNNIEANAEGLVAAYNFENIEGTTVHDITGNHDATLFNFPVVTEGEINISEADIIQYKNFTGRGNDNEQILKIKLTTTGNQTAQINNLKLKLTGTTDINDIEKIKIYTTKNNDKFYPRSPIAKGAILLGSADPSNEEITVSTTDNLYQGTNYIWVTLQIKETATEGNKVDAEVVSIETVNETYNFTGGNPNGAREILLARKLIFAPGDYGSSNYRIPAICTGKDGVLITLTDKRKYNATDLPEDIDIVCKRSTDNGKTWSEPTTVAQGTGRNHGYGDAAIVKTNNDKIVALFVGGPGLGASTPSNPLRTYIVTSEDNGITWTAPRDITSQIYGSECADPERSKWRALFFGSGHMLCTRNNRLMAVAVVKVPDEAGLHNYAVYSDDEGQTWHVSNRAITGGDEAKVVELNNGHILMSSRTQGNRLWAKSEDGGITWGQKNTWTEIWGNACNADIIKYTSTEDGFRRNRMLHTLPNAANRRNVTMWTSYDEGATWPIKKTICSGTSAYSSITILEDNTIGVYIEEDGTIPYKMYFLNFSLDWLTDHNDKIVDKDAILVENPEFSLEEGLYKTNQTLELTCATQGADIYYTLDGSIPNINSTKYTEAISLTKPTTVKAVAVKEGMESSYVITKHYVIGWPIPSKNREVGDNRYLTNISTENAIQNIQYKADEAPNSHYILIDDKIQVKTGETFTLKTTALKDQGDGLQWCQAIILIDWNHDYDFEDSNERIAIIGGRNQDNSSTVMDVVQDITVPNNAVSGTTRMRIVYTDAYRPSSYKDFGLDPVDKGRCYDVDITISNTTGINDISYNNWQIFPNPIKDKFTIKGNEKQAVRVHLISLDGKIVYSEKFNNNIYNLNTNNIESGCYILQITANKKIIYSTKVIKQ